MTWEIREGRNLDLLAEMPDESVQTCITSPPYWGLRDYGEDDQLGLEPTPEEYVENMVAVFREVRRVLRDDGTLWLNLGDSYANTSLKEQGEKAFRRSTLQRGTFSARQSSGAARTSQPLKKIPSGLKPKDLVGIPWRVAFALQADGWYLRSDIIWHKPNPMPESVTDRPTKSHEYIFLLTKQPRYYYDADAIRERHQSLDENGNHKWTGQPVGELGEAPHKEEGRRYSGRDTDPIKGAEGLRSMGYHKGGRNKRSVWTVTTKPFSGAHFAVFPPDLIKPCVLAGASPTACGECGAPYERIVEREGSKPKRVGKSKAKNEQGLVTAFSGYEDGSKSPTFHTLGWQPTCDHSDDSGKSVVLDPFSGSGTTGMVALRLDRSYIGLELNPEYAEMSRNRIRDDAPLLNTGLEAA